MLELVIASKNEGKIKEIIDILDLRDARIYTYKDFPDWPEVEETEATFYGNSLIKARALVEAFGKPAIADDSGLEVDALGGEPGVHSARYAGEPSDPKKNNEKLLRELEGIDMEKRTARFRCVAVLLTPDGWIASADGTLEGYIGFEPHGKEGFGYDPIFIPKGETRTVAEMPSDEKHKISHRGKAFRKLKEKMIDFKKRTKDS